MFGLSRHLALAAFAAMLFVQPALAREHSAVFHRAFYRHGRGRGSLVLREHRKVVLHSRLARLYWHRGVHAFAPAKFVTSPYADDSFASDWRSYAPAASARQSFSRQPLFGDSQRGFASSNAWESERYGEWRFGERSQSQEFGPLQSMAEQQASVNGIPVSLVDRVIKRESGGNPRAVSRGNYGLMQIRLGTARSMGYGGSAAGLLNAETNMTYAVRYLAGAYRAAGGSESRAVALYARGYNAAPRVQYASYDGPQREGGATWQAAGFDDWSGGYARASYRQRLRRRGVF
jgi:soluble lytic murein transglycosylase-like protein